MRQCGDESLLRNRKCCGRSQEGGVVLVKVIRGHLSSPFKAGGKILTGGMRQAYYSKWKGWNEERHEV